jgi:hypothetical protein
MFDHSELNYLRGRVLDLERQLAEERKENRRTERWALNMLMRRAGTFPTPPPAPLEEKIEPVQRFVSETEIAQAESIREYGLANGSSSQEIDDAIQQTTSWTWREIQASRNE